MIVDDESLARTSLKVALSELTDWTIVNESANGDKVKQLVEELQPQVLFLDIRMPGKSGLEVSRELLTLETVPIIVFITAYDKHAIEAFELCALDYLLKPFDDSRLQQTIERIDEIVESCRSLRLQLESFNQLKNGTLTKSIDKLMIRSVGKIEIIKVKDINWIASSGNYVELHLDSRMVLHRVSLNYLAEHLPDDFVRSHRTSIIRISQVSSIETVSNGKYCIIMKSGEKVPLTQSYREQILQKLSS